MWNILLSHIDKGFRKDYNISHNPDLDLEDYVPSMNGVGKRLSGYYFPLT